MPSKPCSSGLCSPQQQLRLLHGAQRKATGYVWRRRGFRVAALDGDWSGFTLAERAALALARKLTVAPHTITDADIDAVRQHFSNAQVLEIVGIVAWIQCDESLDWPLRLTQEDFRLFLDADFCPSLQPRLPALTSPAGSGGRAAWLPRSIVPPSSPGRSSKRNGRNAEVEPPRFPLVDESAQDKGDFA